MRSIEERRAYDREWYRKNRDKRRATIANQEVKARAVIVDAKKSGCSICLEDDPRCLDFHHVGPKSFSISRAIHRGYGAKRIKEEIDKCVVLCANCHRKEHILE